jgi:hypothetical protein
MKHLDVLRRISFYSFFLEQSSFFLNSEVPPVRETELSLNNATLLQHWCQ